MTKEIARALYEGKYFYEIIETKNPIEKILRGPFDNIYFAVKPNPPPGENQIGTVLDTTTEYDFVQVINGIPRVTFTKDQILITDRKI